MSSERTSGRRTSGRSIRHRRRGAQNFDSALDPPIGVPQNRMVYACSIKPEEHAYYAEDIPRMLSDINDLIRETIAEYLRTNNGNIEQEFCLMQFPYLEQDNNLEVRPDTHYCLDCVYKHLLDNIQNEKYIQNCFYSGEQKTED